MARRAADAAQQAMATQPAYFPAQRPAPPHNLPAALSSFIGRERELAAIGRAAGAGRLVTLVGPGGVGKSRLAIEAVRQRLNQHADGLWLVDLAGLADGTLLAREVASVLGIREGPRRSLEAALIRVLGERDLLLLLDNCEHLILACAGLVERLLVACPRLHVLATSREPLRIAGEQLLEVAPLAVPAAGERDARRLRTNEAARLFAERARAVRTAFALTEEVSEPVAEICRRLDGLPLALELAAARLRTLSVGELARGLDERFGLLASGHRTARPRERTLRGMVDWSWELLRSQERVLLRRLAVFAGGWTWEAAEAVCAGDGLAAGEVGAMMSALVERSLVVRDDWRGQTRYRLLDTLRAYAGERLEEADETAVVRRRHQAWYLGRLDASYAEMAVDQLGWLARMDAELDNMRAALDWCSVEPSTVDRALRASPGLWGYWDIRGHADESRQRFAELLALLPLDPPSPGRVLGQAFYAHVVATQGDFARAGPLLYEAVALAPQVHDRAASFWCGLFELQWCIFAGDPAAPAIARAQLAEQRRDPLPFADALLLWYFGAVLLATGELEEAERTLQMAAESTTAELVRGYVADCQGMMVYGRGDWPAAQRFFREALANLARIHSVRGCALAVEHLASVAGHLESCERAARLLGAAEMLYELGSTMTFVPWRLDLDEITAACRDVLGERAFAAAFAAGRALSFERAVQYALEPDGSWERGRRGAGSSSLTPREREIAHLVAEGLSNRRIATALVVSEKTVETHLSHILAKLGLPTRTRLAVWATEQGFHDSAS